MGEHFANESVAFKWVNESNWLIYFEPGRLKSIEERQPRDSASCAELSGSLYEWKTMKWHVTGGAKWQGILFAQSMTRFDFMRYAEMGARAFHIVDIT